jgi:hypothetical protein
MTIQKIIIIGVLLFLAAFLIRVLTWKKKGQAPMNLDDTMARRAEEAVKFANDRGVTLDYSPESVQQVERILAELHQARSKGQLPDSDLDLHAHGFGAYIGEIIRRKYKGHWERDSDVAGPNSYPIHWNGGQSFPIAWCGKRIINGEEDNVWFKFQVVTSDAYRKGDLSKEQSGAPETEK